MFDERRLPALVARVHRADLGDRHVGFVDEQQEIVGEEAVERVGGEPGGRPERGRL